MTKKSKRSFQVHINMIINDSRKLWSGTVDEMTHLRFYQSR